ncbi:MAG: superinfection immunity protein [Gammaproteobacteria bacterium]|nr:superinfection immunity protein [Gammaproteobacteria bacterium]
MQDIIEQLQQQGFGFWLWFVPLFLVIWFLPTILAVFFNRRQLKLIALANVPAGMSFIAWGGCIVWAVTGNLWQKKTTARNNSHA